MLQVYSYYFMIFVVFIFLMILILVGVAFLTLLERKILSYIQLRKGPNKVGFKGIIQPFSDAIKLLSKEVFIYTNLNMIMYMIMPIYMFVLMMVMWLIYPMYSNMLNMENGSIFLMCCFSISVYGMMFVGWSSNSNYSMLGSIRTLSQSISYEVVLSIIFLLVINYVESFNFMMFFNYKFKLIVLWPLSLIFFVSMMAELNRTPFDFSEGESELVSGFNIEYMSSGFILIFLTEYSSIIFMSFMYMLMFSFLEVNSLFFYLLVFMLIILILWIRGSLPRFRYDLLMIFCWLIILPFVLNCFYLMIFYKLILFGM